MYQINVCDYLQIEVYPDEDETQPFTALIRENSNSDKYNPYIFVSGLEDICILQNELYISGDIAAKAAGEQSSTLQRVTESLGLEIQIVFSSFLDQLGFENLEGLPVILVYMGYGPGRKRNAIAVRLNDIARLHRGLEDAYRYIRKSQALVPYNEGTLAMQQGNYVQAVVSLKKAILLDPYSSASVFNLAMCYDLMGQFEDALLWYQRAMGLDSQDPDPVYNVAEIYFRNGRVPEAKKLCREAINLFEKLYQETQYMPLSPEEPLTVRELLADISYKAAVAFHLLALIEAKDGKLQEAFGSIQQAVRIYPRNAQWFVLMAQICHALGYYVEAQEARSRAIEIAPTLQSTFTYTNRNLNLN